MDNTTTPLVCRPAKLGADMATYSATKYVCGGCVRQVLQNWAVMRAGHAA
nr:PLP-dependent transferase [Sinorhizobium meliloti]